MYSKSTGARVAQWVRSLDYLTTRTSLSPIRRGFAPGFVNYKKGCTRLAAASDKVYQLLSHCRWFSPGTPASSTTKTGRHDIAEILLKVALNTINQINHHQTLPVSLLQLQTWPSEPLSNSLPIFDRPIKQAWWPYLDMAYLCLKQMASVKFEVNVDRVNTPLWMRWHVYPQTVVSVS